MATQVCNSCMYSFDDLHEQATGRVMTSRERASLYALPQNDRNQWVRQMVQRTDGRYACEDRRGSDGVIYTAFWAQL